MRRQVSDEITITVTKSPVYLQYPTVYERTVNAAPFEVFRTFAEFEECDIEELPCGSYDAHQQHVTSSEGYCCRCDVGDRLNIDGDPTRAQLECALLGDSVASAHCLRMGPLWYRAFALRPPASHFQLTVAVRRCREGECEQAEYALSPAAPAACADLGGNGKCELLSVVEGDLAPTVQAPTFEGQLLLAPSSCSSEQCYDRLFDGPDKWLLVPRASVTAGEECDKIGVSHQGFATQGARCQQRLGSCTDNQIDDLYEAGEHFLGDAVRASGGSATLELDAVTSGVMSVRAARRQPTLLRLEIAAHSLRYTVNASPAQIRSARVDDFDAAGSAGRLRVHVINIGRLR